MATRSEPSPGAVPTELRCVDIRLILLDLNELEIQFLVVDHSACVLVKIADDNIMGRERDDDITGREREMISRGER